MKVRTASKAIAVMSIAAAIGIAVKCAPGTPTAQETTYTSLDMTMPRQKGFVGMEVADIEYLVMSTPHLEEQRDTSTPDVNPDASPSVQDGMLMASGGVFAGPSGKEKWYNLDMSGVIEIMRYHGYDAVRYPYWVREDGCKMLGDYIMIAANLEVRPRGTILNTSRGQGIVCDRCAAADDDLTLLDLATDW